MEPKSKSYSKPKIRTPTPEPIEVKLSTVIEIILSNYQGVVHDVIENKSEPAFHFLVGQTIRVTHGTVKPCHIELELRKQLDSLHSKHTEDKKQ